MDFSYYRRSFLNTDLYYRCYCSCFIGFNDNRLRFAGMHMENRLHAVPEITFSVDRPFVSMIVNRIGMPYFTTVIVDPTSED